MRTLIALVALLGCLAPPLVGEAEARDPVLYSTVAAGTVHTNSTTEAVLDSTSIPAYSTQAGTIYHWTGSVRATQTNSTDTLTVVGRIGTTALAGTAIFTTGAVDAADDDVVVWDVTLACRSTTSCIASGSASIVGAEGTVTTRALFQSLTITNTSALYFGVTADWSAASASDDVQGESFVLSQLN